MERGVVVKGMVFDIQEFAVNDGPGLRITVFLKGCPLRCRWCHNPEGLSSAPQANRFTGQTVGREWTVDEVLLRILPFKDAFDLSGGGVTFSGGEATAQPEFLVTVASALRAHHIHVNLDTCGYCPKETFASILETVDLVYYDLKCMDDAVHHAMTGVGNALVLANARALAASPVPYRIRVPLTPGVGDTAANRAATEAFVSSLARPPLGIDYLPFNELAGAKYAAYGMKYGFEGTTT